MIRDIAVDDFVRVGCFVSSTILEEVFIEFYGVEPFASDAMEHWIDDLLE